MRLSSVPLALWLLAFLAAPSALAVFKENLSSHTPKDTVDPRVRDRYIIVSHPDIDADVFALHIADVRVSVAVANKKLRQALLQVKSSARQKRSLTQYALKDPEFVEYEQAITHFYKLGASHGYAGTFSPAVLEAIRKKTDVIAYVERDSIMRAMNEQHNAPWGLSRISHGKKPGAGAEKTTYHYPDSAGSGVTAYIIDTGVYTEHKDFNGRAKWGKTFSSYDPESQDGNGHGTHVAANVAGLAFGVAKSAEIVAVKVLGYDGSGTTSDVISGILWTAEDHGRRLRENVGTKNKTRSVANMSLGGSPSQALDDAVNTAVSAGVQFAIAAGNENSNACEVSPARAKMAITVGATNVNDQLADFSNHGKCVDILAPGVDILSAWIGAPDATNTISGTSMASPHVCGLLALTFSEHPDVDFDHRSLLQHILDAATRGAIKKLPKKGHHDNGNQSQKPSESYVSITHDKPVEGSGEGKTPNLLAFVFDSHEGEPEEKEEEEKEATGPARSSASASFVPDAYEGSFLGEKSSTFSVRHGLVPFF